MGRSVHPGKVQAGYAFCSLVHVALTGQTLANVHCHSGRKHVKRKGEYYSDRYKNLGEEGSDQVAVGVEFGFSDDFFTCRSSVTNIHTVTCPGMHASEPPLCVESGHSKASGDGAKISPSQGPSLEVRRCVLVLLRKKCCHCLVRTFYKC